MAVLLLIKQVHYKMRFLAITSYHKLIVVDILVIESRLKLMEFLSGGRFYLDNLCHTSCVILVESIFFCIY